MTEAELRRIEGRWKSDMDLKVDRVDGRVRTIERLVWVATGGVMVLSAVSVIGVSMFFNLSGKFELMATAQAESKTEYRIAEEQFKQRIWEVKKDVEQIKARR